MITIHLIAPSYRIPLEDLDITYQYLTNLGFHTKYPPNIFQEDVLCSNTDEKRWLYLKEALFDEETDMIWVVAGGYGATRLMPYLLRCPKPSKQKLFIGFSDSTCLHLFFNQMWGWPTIHGPTARQIAKQMVGNETIEKMLSLLHSLPEISLQISPAFFPLNTLAEQKKRIKGVVTGGNLCLIQTSIGTPWQLQGKDKWIFLEDVDERGYRIDRILTHLFQAGLFQDVKGVIFGGFTSGLESDGIDKIKPVLKRFSKEAPFPVFSLPKTGHGSENIPIPLGIPLDFNGSKST
ncbi:MAG: LD-carboxypeptidase [Proteobacteria bacterium]|nr:LD-carboxypeptidase [Pseudomonadota bacterium]